MDYKKMYAWLLGAVDDALILIESGNVKGAYDTLVAACHTCEDAYIDACDEEPEE